MQIAALRIGGYDELNEKQFCYWHTVDGWLLYIPLCGLGCLRNHTVVENEDGTISVTPSIKVTGHNQGKPIERHGYLTNGVWTDC